MVIFECELCQKTFIEGDLQSGDRKGEGRIKGICKECVKKLIERSYKDED
jgi:hypothetical protein